jgi:hypothetical protein
MNHVEVHLKASNSFRPNLNFFNQTETAIFGSIKLSLYSGTNSLKSQILNGEQQLSELLKLCEFSPNDQFTLLYRGSRDGFGSNVFHAKCDGHLNTLTIVRAKESSNIFGGFTSVSWESTTNGRYKSDPYAFIFSLTNKYNEPIKININPSYHEFAISCDSRCGPTFGLDGHICLLNNTHATMTNNSCMGWSYTHPQYEDETNEAYTFLAGSFDFELGEIEVYHKE